MKKADKQNKPKKQGAKILLFKPREDSYLNGNQVTSIINKKYPHLFVKNKQRVPFTELCILLLSWRLTKGLSQATVAKNAKVALSTYQLMEEGRPSANPGIKTIWKVAQVYGVESLKEFWAGPGGQVYTT